MNVEKNKKGKNKKSENNYNYYVIKTPLKLFGKKYVKHTKE